MNKVAKAVTGFLTGTIMLTTVGVGYLYSQRDTVIEKIAATASEYATEALGTRVEVGSVKVGELNTGSISDITVSDLAIYDKNSDLIAKAESAEVNFHLLAMASDPLSAIDEIKVHGVEGNVVKRPDGTWNFSDLQTSSEGESNFNTNILIDNIKVKAAFDGNELTADVPNVNLDFDTTADFTADVIGAQVAGTVEGYSFKTGDIAGTLDFDHDNVKADVNAEDIAADVNDSELIVNKISAALDLDEYMNVDADVKVETLGSNVNITAKVTDSKQIVNVDADTVDIAEVLPFVPENIIPDGIEVLGGIVSDAKVNLLKRGDNLSFSGAANLQDGSVMVEQTQIDDVNGSTSFTDAELLLDMTARANGQQAHVTGSIRIDTDDPYLDLNASSDSFNPNAIMYLPAEGTASFTAHLTGTPSNPIVEADVHAPYIIYEDISVADVSTHLKYQDDAVYLSNIRADAFGGTVSGEAELMAMDLSYNAHVKVNGVDVSRLSSYAPALGEVEGRLFGDFGINGVGSDLDSLKIYGSATATNVVYNNTKVISADTSFYVEGDDVKIDYLSAALPDKGSFGAEGTITDAHKLDLKFYAAHVDLSVAKNFVPEINISGLSDFQGSVHGDAENPNVDLKFTAVDGSRFSNGRFKGTFIDQPYDSIKLLANGSLDGIEVNEFTLTKDGKDIWLAKGKVGLTGEKNIDLRVDTVDARAENIAALFHQPLTGNVDNVITITGTLDNPQIVGYIEFSRGSYEGVLITRMAGDYYLNGDNLRLQDFRITSPMIDMVANGTLNTTDGKIDFLIEANDINLKRFQGKLPQGYEAEGHGQFLGRVMGTSSAPLFDGTLTAEELSLNGVAINNLKGHLNLVEGNTVLLENFSFNQGEGTFNVKGRLNYDNNTLFGQAEIANADLPNLLALANLKNDVLTGTLNSTVQFGGTLQNPSIQLVGTIPQGAVAGSDIHDVNLNVNMLNHTIYINTLEGFQGETGVLNATGSAQTNGILDIKLNASNLSLEMIGKAAGLEAELVGTTNIEAVVGGTTDNPAADVDITATGGLKDSTFDLMRGSLTLKDGVIDIEQLIVQKALADKIYQVSAGGQIPLIALANREPNLYLPNSELNLELSLDNADMSLLPLLNKDLIAWSIGEMAGNLKITGTAFNPMINGNILIKEGTTKIKGMKSLIEHMNMNLAFTGNKMTVEDFSGNIGKGTYRLTGGLHMAGVELDDYAFNFVADNLGIEGSFFEGPLNAEFSLTREEVKHRNGEIRAVRPKIAGHLDLDNCTISIPAIPESEGDMPVIGLDIAINLGDKVHFYSPYLFDLYLTGNAKFEGSTEVHREPTNDTDGKQNKDEGTMLIKPSGTITAKRGGTVNYLKTVFNVREGELQFNQFGSFFPTITFAADTRITKTKIFLNVDGRLNDRSIRLTSAPEMSETEIMQLLTLRDAYQKGGDNDLETGDLLMLGLQMSFLSEIEGAVRKTIGFDQFAISRGSGSAFDNRNETRDRHEDEYNVTLGKYITDKTMLKYTRGIGGDNINRYGFQYDFNDRISGTVEREGHASIFGFEARWKF